MSEGRLYVHPFLTGTLRGTLVPWLTASLDFAEDSPSLDDISGIDQRPNPSIFCPLLDESQNSFCFRLQPAIMARM
jgi:hypothetical protein